MPSCGIDVALLLQRASPASAPGCSASWLEHAQVCCIHWRRPATSRRIADHIGIYMAGSTSMHGTATSTSVAARNLLGFGHHGGAAL